MVDGSGHSPSEPSSMSSSRNARPKINYPTRYNPQRQDDYPAWKITMDSYLDYYDLLKAAQDGPPTRSTVTLEHPELDPSDPTTPSRLGALYRHEVAAFFTSNRELFNVLVSYLELSGSIELTSMLEEYSSDRDGHGLYEWLRLDASKSTPSKQTVYTTAMSKISLRVDNLSGDEKLLVTNDMTSKQVCSVIDTVYNVWRHIVGNSISTAHPLAKILYKMLAASGPSLLATKCGMFLISVDKVPTDHDYAPDIISSLKKDVREHFRTETIANVDPDEAANRSSDAGDSALFALQQRCASWWQVGG
jgi:hypothetical protein